MSDLHRVESPQVQVARAVRCCAGVARLSRRYGGAVMFHPVPVPEQSRSAEYARAPARGFQIKRTLKGLS